MTPNDIANFGGGTAIAMLVAGALAEAASRPGPARNRAAGLAMVLVLLAGTTCFVIAGLQVAPAG